MSTAPTWLTLRPASAGAFDEASTLFELAWYGDRATGAAEAARFESLADDVLTDAAQ